jgi:hypothetical protein
VFHLKELNKAVSELDPYTGTFKEKSDKISEDILNLEKYLSAKFIGIEIGIEIADHKLDDEQMKLLNLSGMGKDLNFLLKEFLIWGKDESSKNFRLMYKTLTLKGDKVNGYQIIPEQKPLIERPLFDRLRVYPHLPTIIEKIKNLLM